MAGSKPPTTGASMISRAACTAGVAEAGDEDAVDAVGGGLLDAIEDAGGGERLVVLGLDAGGAALERDDADLGGRPCPGLGLGAHGLEQPVADDRKDDSEVHGRTLSGAVAPLKVRPAQSQPSGLCSASTRQASCSASRWSASSRSMSSSSRSRAIRAETVLRCSPSAVAVAETDRPSSR